MIMQRVLLMLHLSSAIVWVGGMFFAYVCLRPAAIELLEPPARLRLWRGVFSRWPGSRRRSKRSSARV